ncbi:hypothetical protein D3C79_942090 [compost metagenome]
MKRKGLFILKDQVFIVVKGNGMYTSKQNSFTAFNSVNFLWNSICINLGVIFTSKAH